ncbi:MAG: Type 1 glutamine amidotransferase-like domain-containing protein [Candidatus ainarchaeum sp.]|nr:Type 1 glutamine amidotransferase-like domain-containing protein [Candidatus ainarchaeum sp.]
MRKIIAIGGGEIGRQGFPVETTKIDKEIILQTHKKNPILLFLPTASSDSQGYFEVVKKHFSKLGCKVDVLYLINTNVSKKQIMKKILNTDIIYVGGGNTMKMIHIWKKKGVDKALKAAHKKGIVLSGLSAGAICWFKFGNSDSKLKETGKLIKVRGLDYFCAALCPHYDAEKERKPALKEMMIKTKGVAIALDNCCAIEIIGEKYRIIKSKSTAKAYKVFWKNKKFFENEILSKKKFEPVEELFKKDLFKNINPY